MSVEIRFDMKAISKDNEKIYNQQNRYYKSRRYKEFEDNIRHVASKYFEGSRMPYFVGNVGIEICFYFRNRRHCDLTNLPKGVCDALNGIAYKDDSYIKEAKLVVIEDSKTDYFVVRIYEV